MLSADSAVIFWFYIQYKTIYYHQNISNKFTYSTNF